MDSNRPNSSTKLFNLNETSQRLNVSAEILLRWNEYNILKPTITLEGTIGYTEEQINQFLTIRQLVQEDNTGRENTDNVLQSEGFKGNSEVNELFSKNTFHAEEGLIQAHSSDNYTESEMGTSALQQEDFSNLEKTKRSFLPLVSYFAVLFLVSASAVFVLQGGFKLANEQSGQSYQKVLGTQTSELKSSGATALSMPVQLRKDSIIDNNLYEVGESVLKEKLSASNVLYPKSPRSIDVSNSVDLAKAVPMQGLTYSTFLKQNSNSFDLTGDASSPTPYASRTTDKAADNNLVFDEQGKIKGEVKNPLATTLGGIGVVSGTDSLKQSGSAPMNGIILLTIGILSFILVFPKRFAYVNKNQQITQIGPVNLFDTASKKIIEVDQKTDGTIVLYFHGKEYKISKPELYSESDQFIERLMELVKPGIKEIEYVSLNDEKVEINTPLSRLVTRLGFVGIKRELFFPRTSKDRVLFRRYLTMQDLTDMNLTTNQISSDLTVVS